MDIIDYLEKQGIELRIEDGRLKLRGDREVMTSLLDEIKENKERIIQQYKKRKILERIKKYFETATLVEKDSLICYSCGSNKWWVSIYGRKVCRVCHPPASNNLIAY